MDVCVEGEDQRRQDTTVWAPVLMVQGLDVMPPNLTCCPLSVRKLMIHWQVEADFTLGNLSVHHTLYAWWV